MPYAVRQQAVPSVPPGASQQAMYNSPTNSPFYGSSQHLVNPQQHHRQDPMLSNRPLFRNHSTSSIVPNHHSTHENLLRRKTPSGTLPAAYDAAPMEYTPRPNKQILLPYQDEVLTGHHDCSSQGLGWADKTMGQAAHPLVPQGIGAGSNVSGPMFSTEWSPQSNGQFLPDDSMMDPNLRQFLLQQQQQTVPPFPDQLWMNSHLSGFQPMYNPITAPTASCDEVNRFLMNGGYIVQNNVWQNNHYYGWGTGPSTPSSQLPQAVDNLNLNTHHGHATQNAVSDSWWDQLVGTSTSATQSMYPSTLSQETPSYHNFEHLSAFPVRVPERSALPTREKAAVWAHRAYVDLLSSIHVQQRQNADGTGNTISAKTGLYPRPPKIAGLKSALRQNLQLSSGNSRHYSNLNVESPDRRKRMRAGMAGNLDYSELGTSSHSLAKNEYQFPGHANGSAGQLYNHQGSSLASAPENSASLVTALNATTQALAVLETLEKMCIESSWTWLDGMMLGGCLAYGLGDLNQALIWYRRILEIDEGHVEALSNCAATLLSLHRKEDAEQFWRQAVKKRPSYLEAVEHLVGLLCGDHRAREAVEIIKYVEATLRRPGYLAERNISTDGTFIKSEVVDPGYTFGPKSRSISRTTPTFGLSPFVIPGSENGRMLALIHAKGNMLYTLGDNIGAAKAFEDAVLVAAGIPSGGIQALIDKILVVLKAATEGVNLSELSPNPPQTPVLLQPERAVQTARLVFPPNGELPGLRDIATGAPLKAAIATTSNSLLSLAKIFQDGMSSGGTTAGRPGASVKDILALYYLSMSLHPSPSTANNVGILLASIQQASPTPGMSTSQSGASIGVNLALMYYNYGLKLDHRHAHLYTNLGSLLKDINQLGHAIKMYELAVSYDPSFDIALANLANAVKDQGRLSDAVVYYRRAVKANPEFAEAVCGLANVLNSVCDWKGRGGIVRDGGNRDRWHVDDTGMLTDARAVGALSSGWMKRVVEIVEKQLEQGESWGKHALADETFNQFVQDIEYAENGYLNEARSQALRFMLAAWVGQRYEGAKIIRLIERASRKAVWRWYRDKYVYGIDKPVTEYRRPRVPSVLTTPSAPTVLPFHTFTCPLSAKEVRLISERNGLRISCSTLRSSWLSQHVYPPPAPPRPYLRVGYVSSDFNNHPLAHLMQSVFGLHDPSRVKAYCYATTASDNSEHRKQIERESPMFYDAHSWGPDRLVQQIVDDGIHILINLNGFTRGARNEVFAARPAPIQMSFMGFAGTLGAEWCDYLYADTTAVPTEMLRNLRRNVDVDDSIRGLSEGETEESSWVYAENIIFARYTFFCCDHRQSAPDAKLGQLSWEEEVKRRWEKRKEIFPDIEDDQIILGNFNQLYKIEPTTFRTWLRILAAVPKAILWLLRFPELGESNLLGLAEMWASKEVASRIWFTDVAPKYEHIKRAQVCDLFLDTPECNAHTTAADVLWSGTPLLTLPRHKHKMCSRIAASILRAAVPQNEKGKAMANSLVADSEDIYERRAIELASGLEYRIGGDGECTGELADIRKVLFTNRWTSELFNTKRWVSDLEDAYEEAWRRWVCGEGGDIDLKEIKPVKRSVWN